MLPVLAIGSRGRALTRHRSVALDACKHDKSPRAKYDLARYAERQGITMAEVRGTVVYLSEGDAALL